MSEEIKCDICGKTGFKSKAGLAGHKKIAHGADTRKTIPDEIGKRLINIEHSLRLMDAILMGYGGDWFDKFVKEDIPLPRKFIEETLERLNYLKKVKEDFKKDGIWIPQIFNKQIEDMEKVKQVKVKEKEALTQNAE